MAVTITVQFPDLSRAIRKAAGPAIQRKGEEYGEQLVTAVKSEIVASGLKTRPANRRRTPGSVHLINGWSYKVAGDPVNYPLLVNLVARGDAAYLANIGYQNDGTPGHTIRGRQARGPGGQFGRTPWLRFPASGDGGRPAFAKQVSHPGTTGRHFIEAAAASVSSGHARRFG
jgi:hypothetical protein